MKESLTQARWKLQALITIDYYNNKHGTSNFYSLVLFAKLHAAVSWQSTLLTTYMDIGKIDTTNISLLIRLLFLEINGWKALTELYAVWKPHQDNTPCDNFLLFDLCGREVLSHMKSKTLTTSTPRCPRPSGMNMSSFDESQMSLLPGYECCTQACRAIINYIYKCSCFSALGCKTHLHQTAVMVVHSCSSSGLVIIPSHTHSWCFRHCCCRKMEQGLMLLL